MQVLFRMRRAILGASAAACLVLAAVPVAAQVALPSPDFTLDWDPEPALTTSGPACPGEGCPPQAAVSGGGKAVAALR